MRRMTIIVGLSFSIIFTGCLSSLIGGTNPNGVSSLQASDGSTDKKSTVATGAIAGAVTGAILGESTNINKDVSTTVGAVVGSILR